MITFPPVRVSVCLVTYNGEKFLQEQLESILQQLGENDEIIIIDNNSTDSTKSIIKEHCSHLKNVFTVFLHQNIGIPEGFELAFLIASGQYVFLCDQDDVWMPGRIEKQVEGLKNADLSICNAALVDSYLRPLSITTFSIRKPKLGWGNLYKNAFIGSTMAMTRNAALKVLPFPAKIPMHDWYIAQVSYKKKFRLHVENEVLHLYRRHGNTASITGKVSNRSLLQKLLDRLYLLWYTMKGFL